MAITVAVDFLHCLRRSLTQELHDGQVHVLLHSYAQMAMLRGAVENALLRDMAARPPESVGTGDQPARPGVERTLPGLPAA